MACGPSHEVTIPVDHPPLFALETHRGVWLASQTPEAVAVADQLAARLAGSSAELHRVSIDALEPARQRQTIPRGTLVLIVEVTFQDTFQSRFGQRPETICGATGCYTQYRSYRYLVPQVRGELQLTGYDGPSARRLGEHTMIAQRSGNNTTALRQDVASALADQALTLFRPRRGEISIRFLEEGAEEGQAALRLLEDGHIPEGVLSYQTWTASRAFAELPPGAQAIGYHNLGLAFRLAAFSQTDAATRQQHLANAVESLEAALQRAPDGNTPQGRAHAQALVTARAELSAQRRLLRQETEAGPTQATVPVPPSYE